MDTRYPELASAIERRGIKKKVIALACDLSEKGFYNKYTGKHPFTWPETKKIQSTFFPDIPIDRLFAEQMDATDRNSA